MEKWNMGMLEYWNYLVSIRKPYFPLPLDGGG
jgi:hypothetical protein